MIERGSIIINADDFGLSPSVNKAIIELFDNGLINSSTLMANMTGFEEAVELIHNRKIEKRIGVHLVLTDGNSLTEDIKKLDIFFNKKISGQERIKKLFFLEKDQKKLIFKEYSAQIEKVKSNGIPISHLDTHHQLHDMWSIMQILIELLKTYKIPSIRILNNLEKTDYFYKNAYRSLINQYLRFRKVNFTDYLGNQYDFMKKFESKSSFFNNKRVEIMVHPDFKKSGLLIDKVGNKESDFLFRKEILDSVSNF